MLSLFNMVASPVCPKTRQIQRNPLKCRSFRVTPHDTPLGESSCLGTFAISVRPSGLAQTSRFHVCVRIVSVQLVGVVCKTCVYPKTTFTSILLVDGDPPTWDPLAGCVCSPVFPHTFAFEATVLFPHTLSLSLLIAVIVEKCWQQIQMTNISFVISFKQFLIPLKFKQFSFAPQAK